MKTLFTIALSILTVIVSVGYPFQPSQLMFLELFIIGFASLALSIEPNNKRIEGSFIKTVLIRSIPNAIALLVPVVTVLMLNKLSIIDMATVVGADGNILKYGVGSAVATIAVTVIGFINLVFICRPYSKWRAGVVGIVAVLLIASAPVVTFLMNDMLELTPVAEKPIVALGVLGLGVGVALLIHLGKMIFNIVHPSRSN
jgi:cation-transporting ATPase E